MPAQVNARLTAVHGADTATGGRDDWDAPVVAATGVEAPTGPAKWTDGADAYYLEAVEVLAGEHVGGIVATRSLIIDSSVARAAGIDTDDVLTFTDPAGATRRARAARITRSELDGIPDRLQTTRLDLEER